MCWDDEGRNHLRRGTHVARMPHRCDEGCRINPGDTYHYGVGLFDGEFYSWKLCQPCETASSALGAACRIYDRYSTNPPIGMLREAYQEHLEYGELDTEAVPAATVWKLRRHYVALRKRSVA